MRRLPVALLTILAAVLAGASPAAAAKRTVAGELDRLVASGALDAGTADGYRAVDLDARRTVKRLHGTRRRELGAVVTNVAAAAAGGRFAPSRLPALFETEQRNRTWWATAPLPAAGHRVAFGPGRIVWQYYPGQGLQIQWLATFGKANALWRAGGRDEELRALVDEALGLATQRAGGLAFEYLFHFDGGRPPWVSGLAQGTGLSALARASVRLGEPRYLEAARAALGIFRTPPPEGVRVPTDAGAHYLQYSYAPRLHVANGFVQALNGLHDLAAIGDDAEARALFGAGEAQLRAELPGFDTGAWSIYALGGAAPQESDLGYHVLLRDVLRGLCDRLTDDRRRAVAAQVQAPAAPPAPAAPDPAPYCDTAQRFTTDLSTPPAVALLPATLRARRDGRVRLTLSKVSTVTLTVLRAGEVVLQRSARMGRGTRAFGLRPRIAGPLELRLRAVDLAGNAAQATGAAHVRPAPRHRKAKAP